MPECQQCGKPFESNNPKAARCSKECRRAWEKTPAGRAANRAAVDRYRRTAKGRRARDRCNRTYDKTEKGRAANRRGRRTYYLKKKSLGLCCNAGCRRKAWNGYVRCKKCHAALLAYGRRSSAGACTG